MYIDLDEEREAEIESCFSCDVDFHYPKPIEQFKDLLQVFKAHSKTAKRNENDDNNSLSDEIFKESNGFGEKITHNKLIVMDAFGLADESKKNFLIVARKFNYTCVYIFHVIYPEKPI